jgi:hypothetical protein
MEPTSLQRRSAFVVLIGALLIFWNFIFLDLINMAGPFADATQVLSMDFGYSGLDWTLAALKLRALGGDSQQFFGVPGGEEYPATYHAILLAVPITALLGLAGSTMIYLRAESNPYFWRAVMVAAGVGLAYLAYFILNIDNILSILGFPEGYFSLPGREFIDLGFLGMAIGLLMILGAAYQTYQQDVRKWRP